VCARLIELGTHLVDWIGYPDFYLSEAVKMG
jgi:hypothetical protein